MKSLSFYSLIVTASLLLSISAYADEYIITLKNNAFSPKELVVPAGHKIKIIVKNQDATPVEFESSDFNREKLIGANSEVSIFIGPLEAGRYTYFNDFHLETTGAIFAK